MKHVDASRHVSPEQLALYAQGDLGFWTRRRVERHTRRCAECAGVADEFIRQRDEMADAAAGLPFELSGPAWNVLASEMTANIRLAMAAGECVSPRLSAPAWVPQGRPRLTLALAGLAVLLVWAGLERPGADSTNAVFESNITPTLESSEAGVAVHGAGRAFTVAAPAGSNAIRTVNARGEVRSRYVDDTGVTIVNVYAE